MACTYKKALHILLSVALINSSIQPLYASIPEREDEVVREVKAQTRLLILEDRLQEKLKSSATVIESWTPSFIKSAASKIGAWFESTFKDLPVSYFAKSPLEVDYARDRAYWLAHFSTAIDDIKDSGLSGTHLQERLMELQDLVFNGVLLPSVYEEALKDLSTSLINNQAVFATVRSTLKESLRHAPAFIEETFRQETSSHIQALKDGSCDSAAFSSLVHYYRDIVNPLDYKNILQSIRSYLREHKKEFQITVKDYKEILGALTHEIGLTSKEERERFKDNQAFSLAASSVLPYFGQDWDEIATPTNTSLDIGTRSGEEGESCLSASAKVLRKAVYTGAKFVHEHPAHALMMVLAGQVAASAAYQTLSGSQLSKGSTKHANDQDASHEENIAPLTPAMLKRMAKRNIGDEFLVNQNDTLYTEGYASVVRLMNGKVFAVWEQRQGADYDIYGRIFFPNGTGFADAFVVNQNTTLLQEHPSATALNDGNIFVTWTGHQNDVASYVYGNIYGCVLSSNGTSLTNEFNINQISYSAQYEAKVASLKNNDVLVAWHVLRSTTLDVYGRLFAANGVALGNEFGINQITNSDQYSITVAPLLNGNTFVGWQGHQSSNYDIYGRILYPNGTALTNEFTINQNSIDIQQVPISAATLNEDNIFVVWHGFQSGDYDIYGRVLFPNGTALNNEFTVNQNTTLHQLIPRITVLSDGNVLAAWQGSQSGNYDIYGRVFSPQGIALSGEFILNQDTVNNQIYPSIVGLSGNNVFAVWQGDQSEDIYGRILTPSIIPSLGTTTVSGSSTTLSTTGTTSSNSATMGTGTTGIVTTGATLTGSSTTGGGMPIDPNEFRINQNTTWIQEYPSLASLGNGDIFVAWDGSQNGYDIYGRIFSVNGTVLSDEFGINQITTGYQYGPRVKSLSNGDIFIAWNSDQTGDYNVYGRLFKANGTALSNDFGINQNTFARQLSVSVASLTNGNIFAAWEGEQTGDWDIYSRVLAANGTALSDDFLVNQNTTSSQNNPFVASLINGNVFVTWHGLQRGDYDIYGRIFAPNGTALSDEFAINQNTTAQQSASSIASLTNGNVFVAWDGQQTGAYDVYGRVFALNGTALGPEFNINQVTAEYQFYPSVGGLVNGNAFVAWQSNQGGDFNIYGRVFSSNGTALTNELTINLIPALDQRSPAVLPLSNNDVVIVWQGQQSGDYDIYGRTLTPSILPALGTTSSSTTTLTTGTANSNSATMGTGTTGIVTTGATLTGTSTTGGSLPLDFNDFRINQNTTADQYNPSVARLGNDNVFVTWEGRQTGNAAIYGRIFSSSGTALGAEFGVSQNVTAWQRWPSVVGLIDGNAFITWHGAQTSDNDIYGRIFFPNGTAFNNEYRLNQNTTLAQYYPHATSLNNGNIFVAWQGLQDGGSNVYGRIFFSNGTAIDNEFKINQFMASDIAIPSVIGLSNGNAFASWTWIDSPSMRYDLYGRVFSPNGIAVDNEFRINQNTTISSSYSSLALLNNGNILTVWQGQQGANYNLYGRLLLSNGTAFSNELKLASLTMANQDIPAIVRLSNGNIFLALPVYPGSDFDILGEIFFPNGTAFGNTFNINQNVTADQTSPSLASLSNGNTFVVWTGSETGNYDIYGRIFNSNGTVIPTTGTSTTSLSTTGFQTTATTSTTNGMTTDPTMSTTSSITTGMSGTTNNPSTGTMSATDIATSSSLSSSSSSVASLSGTTVVSTSSSISSTTDVQTSGATGQSSTTDISTTDTVTSTASSISSTTGIQTSGTIGQSLTTDMTATDAITSTSSSISSTTNIQTLGTTGQKSSTDMSTTDVVTTTTGSITTNTLPTMTTTGQETTVASTGSSLATTAPLPTTGTTRMNSGVTTSGASSPVSTAITGTTGRGSTTAMSTTQLPTTSMSASSSTTRTATATLTGRLTTTERSSIAHEVKSNQNEGSSSNDLAIGLGVGLGVGVPVIITAGIVLYKYFPRNNEQSSTSGENAQELGEVIAEH